MWHSAFLGIQFRRTKSAEQARSTLDNSDPKNGQCVYEYALYKQQATPLRVQVRAIEIGDVENKYPHLMWYIAYEYAPWKQQATPLRVRVRTVQIASMIMCARVQVRVLPLVAKVIQFRLRRNSNQCTLKKKRPKRNIVRK